MRTTLLSTVGTSLFSNLRHLRQPGRTLSGSEAALLKAMDAGQWRLAAKALLAVPPTERLCGAEINTIEEARKKRWLDVQRLVFLVSDTDEGRQTGELLKAYFEQRDDLGLEAVEYRVVDQLQPDDPKAFRTHGLRNLVRLVGDLVQRTGREQVAIDATGGFKAQIAVAVLIGLALDIPVYYKHEVFPEIIDFPPMPVALDYDLLGRHGDLLAAMERGKSFAASELGPMDEKLRVFLTEVDVDGDTLLELSAIGQLYLLAFRMRYPKVPNLLPLPPEQRKEPTFGNDHHYPKGFKEYVAKVWRENDWIKTIWSLDYGKQDSIRKLRNGFHVQEGAEGVRILIGIYMDKSYGARFQVALSSQDPISLTWAAERLNGRYLD